MIRTSVCDLLGIEHPIIQGGMAHVSTTELASAVSNAGGLGIIGTGNAGPDWVREQIRSTRQQTNNPFGVNIIMISPFVEEAIAVILEEKVAVVTIGAGNPVAHIPRLKETGIKVIPVVASVALARRLERSGADAVVAEGAESGGHVGETTTMALVPQVVSAIDVPVIAAGGVADGRGMAAVLALGAQGVQIGTRFICSVECIAHPRFKEKVLRAGDRATVVIGQSTGYPVRCLDNRMTRQSLAMEKDGVPPEVLDEFGTGRMRLALIEGDVDEGSLMAGQISGLIHDIKPVRDIVRDIMTEAEAVIDGMAGLPR